MALPPLDQYVAMDCETVLLRSGQALAKVGMVNHNGDILLESFVFCHPQNVIDYVSVHSGIHPGDLDGAPTFEQIQPKIKAIIKDKILVGHAVFNDLAYIQHRHPYESVRDTSLYIPLRQLVGVQREGEYPSLKKLAAKVLDQVIQAGEHDPVEDARATMAIFMSVREAFEESLEKCEEVVSGIPASFERWYW
ncbi:MAG: hypothetical protein TREMPRED_004333 [Tremellales sp. Tagirdzhanova-0007]|nr:MAG: hypothetical protein TREMPRED_004333 [Tremellales sp. Tagirdzhanova-0007]